MSSEDASVNRRDFLYIATGATGAVAVGSAVWPLVDQMNPDAAARALLSIEVDFSALEVGAQIIEEWQGKPVFIRRRTEAEIAEAREVTLEALPDPAARNENKADDAQATDDNRSFEDGSLVIMVGLCTHFGCVPNMDGGDYGGWYCPCHGSHYDIAGRIRKGPAPRNMDIPPISFPKENVVKIG